MPSFAEERGMEALLFHVFLSSPHWSRSQTLRAWARGTLKGPMTVHLRLAVGLTLAFITHARAANHVAEVLEYHPGSGAAAGFDQVSSVMGEPSRLTPGEFGGPVDPFSAPWQPGQLLSIGEGGSITLRFAQPVLNHPANPLGLDFLVFGSAAFVITNGDFTGGGLTDGSLFGNNAGSTLVSVSADGASYFPLDTSIAPSFDSLFPTDGSGDFTLPVDPSLDQTAFAGLGLAGIRGLYAGSAGGTGYDLAWARDTSGNPISLDQIQFVRLDVLSDRAEVDALTAVPEPGPVALTVTGMFIAFIHRLSTQTRKRQPRHSREHRANKYFTRPLRGRRSSGEGPS
jgi:hypothetical protein